AVEIVTQKTGMQAIVEAGQQRRFDAKTISVAEELPLAAASWEQALLSVSHWPLSQLIDELARYQSGYLSCASDAANLRVSGTFPLDNIPHAITLIARVLPIKVRYVSRYWARVSLR
ncbi:MAG: iron dicitrate transport regulator FecR, partial [Enterobacterales bacterium]|nr:iron dicitrate transport regulator FecR [Enterobacterales bacterium]